MEDGQLTGVSFTVEVENQQGRINWSNYNTHMILASLSFAAAQDEAGLFSPGRITEKIEQYDLESFEFSECGVEIACGVKYSGYIDVRSGFLLTDKDVADNYFKVHFSLNRKE